MSTAAKWGPFATILGVALIIGLLVGVSNPEYVLVGAGVVVLLVAGAIWPLPALLVAIALLYEAIPIGAFVSFGSLKPHELLFGYLTIIVFIRSIFARRALMRPMQEFQFPIWYLIACIAMSLVYSIYFTSNQYIITELRPFVIWFVLPLLLLSVNSHKDYRLLLQSVIAIGLVVAVIVTIQTMFNVRILFEARVEKLDGELNSDVTRSIAGGATYLIIFALYYVIMMPQRFRWATRYRLIAALILVSGLAVSFGRGVWMATALCLLIATFVWHGLRGVVTTALVGSIAVVVVLSAAALFNPRLTEAIIDRATGIGDEVESGGSFGWRRLENQAASIVISQRPWTGVGLGGEYKKTISSEGHFAIETFYIHNAYIGYAVKMGIQAAAFPPLMILCFLIAARRIYRNSDSDTRCIVAALIGAFLVPVVTSYTQPEWLTDQGIAAFCIFIALLLLTGRKFDGEDVPVDLSTLAPLSRQSGTAATKV